MIRLIRWSQSRWEVLNLRQKLSVAFVVMTLFPLLVSAAFTEWEAGKLLRQFVFDRNKNLALNIAHDVDQLFAEKISMMKVVVADVSFRSMQTPQQTMMLQEMVRVYDGIHIAAVMDLVGRQTARSDGVAVAESLDYTDREYFAQVMQNRTTAVSDVLISKSAGWPGVVIAEPILDENRSAQGVLVVNVGLSSIVRMIEEALVDQQSYAYVVNKNGKVIIHTDPLQANAEESLCRQPITKALAGETGWLEYECGGQKILAGYSFLPNVGWGLVVESSLSAAMAEVNDVHTANFFIIVASVLLTILISLSIAQAIAARISEISKAALRVASGDFQTRLPVDRTDEIGSLANNFNQMTEQLELRTVELCASEARFRSLVDNINIGVYQSSIDDDGRFIQVNPAMVQMFGYPAMVLLLKIPLNQLYHDVADHHFFLQQLKQKGFIKNQECLMRRYGGEPFWCSRSAVARMDKSGNVQWIEGVVEDIAERKLAENLLRKAKEELEIQVAARTSELTKLNEELHHLSLSDGLTGIGNRRSLDEVLDREWKRAVREHAKLAVLMIDIDYFKLFNDAYGHLAGDECLKKVAATINGIIKRSMDFAGRYGGEEFAVILPATDEHGAMTVGEKIRATIEAAAIPHQRSYLGGVVTVSIGVAVMLPDLTTEAVLLIDAADQALYTAKSSGRNQVALAE